MLADLGLWSGAGTLRYDVNLTTGDAISMAVYVDDERFLHVRASEWVSLQPVYASTCRAYRLHADTMARPHGHRTLGRWSVMVCDGVEHRGIRRPDVLRGRWRRPAPLAGALQRFLAAGRDDVRGGGDRPSQRAFVEAMGRHFEALAVADRARRVIDAARADGLEDLPWRDQHGDFVANNLGCTDGRLVVFDWEDYGKAGIPGLDLFTLMLSLLGMDARGLAGLVATEAATGPVATFLQAACEAQAIDVAQFRRLVPCYLLVFLYLKRHYGEAIQRRLAALLSTLDAAAEND